MRTLSKLYPTKPTIYTSEVGDCPECGQPVADRILVALHQACGRTDRDSFRQMMDPLLVHIGWRSNPGIGSACPTGKPMPAFLALQAERALMPPRRFQPRPTSRLTITVTIPIPTIASRQVHDHSSLIQPGNCNRIRRKNGLLPCPPCYRDTTRF
jgi:hypothetical protein